MMALYTAEGNEVFIRSSPQIMQLNAPVYGYESGHRGGRSPQYVRGGHSPHGGQMSLGFESGDDFNLCPDKKKPYFDPTTAECIPTPKGSKAKKAFEAKTDAFYEGAVASYLDEQDLERIRADQRKQGQSFWDKLFPSKKPAPAKTSTGASDAAALAFFQGMGGATKTKPNTLVIVGGLAVVGVLAYLLLKKKG